MCVCVCVCVCKENDKDTQISSLKHPPKILCYFSRTYIYIYIHIFDLRIIDDKAYLTKLEQRIQYYKSLVTMTFFLM